MKRIIVFILALSLLLTMAACSEAPASSAAPPEETPEASSPSPEVPAAPKPSQEPVPEVSEEPEELKYNDFFTGLPLAEQDYSRPFAIMINNLKPALPHHGVSQADLIFELPVEGGITRMLGIFTDMDNIDKIGSVRSLRPYYADIAAAYDAVLVHAGYSIDAIIRKNALGLDNMDGITDGGGAEAFARDEERYAAGIGVEHTLFGTGPSIKAYAEKVGYELSVSEDYDSGLRFAESAAPSGGQNAGKLTVNFGYKTTEFSYDAEKGVYTTKGEKLWNIEKAALSLENGQYSEVVRSTEGHHIVMRLPIEESYVDKHLEDLELPSFTRRYHEFVESRAKDAEVKYNKYYDTLTHEMLTKLETP